jgi:signal transduction histidine kinase
LINIVKHAKAENIFVTIKGNKENIFIDIEDDGVGFVYSPELYRFKSKSMGLFSVHERISDIGGSMVIDSKFDQGTKVSLVIPITD